MSAEERKQILQMVEEGKITADQALTLIKELEQDAAEEASVEVLPSGFAGSDEPGPSPELDRTAAQARGLWQIPLWIGMAVTVLAALGIYSVMSRSGYGFWFYCLWLPFLLGVGLMAVAAWSRTARWLFVNVDRSRSTDGPRRIFLGFPLPLNLASWFLRTFGRYIQGFQNSDMDQVVQAISLANSMEEPLVVNVDDSEDGSRVQVFIG
ncbi:MAG TPA: hypothetical protein VIV15_00595 [Anaerolineales bacterium]